ncbi:MAG: hypothetical protein J6Y59_03535, partial [Bacteroidaceae bacterium]|nr:hypothetical protein [Bacteroidaceae bacterium]
RMVSYFLVAQLCNLQPSNKKSLKMLLKIGLNRGPKFGSVGKFSYLCSGFRTEVQGIENRARFRCMN